MAKAIQVATDLLPSTVLDVPVIHAARFMLERARSNGGLMMTKGGALARIEVNAIVQAMDWPDFDRASLLAVSRVLNEADVLPILSTRMVVHEAAGEKGLPAWMRGRLYRKSPLFDQALAFAVGVSPPGQPLQ